MQASKRTLDLIQQLGDRGLEADAYVMRSTVRLASGNYSQAELALIALGNALVIPTGAADCSSMLDKQRANAVTQLRAGDYTAALNAADCVTEMVARQLPTGYHWVDFYASAIEVYLQLLTLQTNVGCEGNALLKRTRDGCKRLRKLER